MEYITIKPKLSKAQKDLLAYLGPQYTTLVIDLELCLYRDFGEFDVEISGGHDRRRKSGFSLYVWDKRTALPSGFGAHIIEQHQCIGWDFAFIKTMLDQLAEKYKSGENIPPWEARL